MTLRVPFFLAGEARLRLIASAALAVALAIFAGTFFTYINVVWAPRSYGQFGLNVLAPDVVDEVVPGSPADNSGIKAGDRVERPQSLHERLVLFPDASAPRPGEKITLTIVHAKSRRTTTLQARSRPPLLATDSILLIVKCLWLLIFLLIALALVLLRPSRMTWGFYLFALNLVLIFGPPAGVALSNMPASWQIARSMVGDVIAPAGVAGFLVFCVRFPTNTSFGWRRIIERLAPFLFAIIAAWLVYSDFSVYVRFERPSELIDHLTGIAMLLAYLTAACLLMGRYACASEPERHEIKWVTLALVGAILACVHDLRPGGFEDAWSIFAAFMLGTVVVVITYLGTRGLDRHRIKWVVFGFVCALGAAGADFLGLRFTGQQPRFGSVPEVLYVALPLTVAYAVIRHRVIDIRFAVSRALVVAAFAAVLALAFLGIDWLFSARLPTSRFEAFIYAGIALVIGFCLNAARQSIGKSLDFLFFRQWYRTQEEAGTIADGMRQATSTADVYNPLTAGIADAFSLASVALFERVADGGFVRVAACGWPCGTMWHILPDDALAVRADNGARVADIEALNWHQDEVPAGIARPTVMLPISGAKSVPAVLLCGAHKSGSALDRDELRMIRRSCADAALIYGRAATHEPLRTDSLAASAS